MRTSGEKTHSRPSAQTVRAAGNFALTICAVLLVLAGLTPHAWAALAALVLAIVGVGARIEAAILANRD
jgi:heme/copper-type cytochrome/quinol oxidase subunit 4